MIQYSLTGLTLRLVPLGNSTWENVILLPLTCEDKRPNGRGEHEMLDKYPIDQNKGDMMKIEMKHHPGVTVL